MHVRWLLLFTLLATLLVSVDFPQQAKATPAKATTLAAATCTETTQTSEWFEMEDLLAHPARNLE